MNPSAWSWRHAIVKSDLPPVTRHVLLTLSVFMNDMGGGCYPSTKRLAECTGLSERTVCTHLAAAADRGWLIITQHGFKGRKWKAHQYEAAWPQGAEGGSAPHAEGAERGSVPQPPEALNVVQRGTEGGSVYTSNRTNYLSSAGARAPRNVLLDVLDEPTADALLVHFERMKQPLDEYRAELKASQLAEHDDPNAAARLLIKRAWVNYEPEWQPSPRRAGEDDGGGKAKPPATRFVHAAKAKPTWRWCCAKTGHDPKQVDERGGWEFPADLLDEFLNLPAAEHANGQW
ncbi:Helix-turn-helix domain-containing protein [Devosia enhydra]|uniref:Helix-turn-helix domain-containing protein n=1 Tax=Devosia enhydra TaxID=665118 RepID=A0A1K2HV93_9HYPH|nr:helix-turn-helix domain-containing protein [Devosia enhydra]SFZ82400.1 Helix-turn-helix domain-containing protein [Devosia enhydra]